MPAAPAGSTIRFLGNGFEDMQCPLGGRLFEHLPTSFVIDRLYCGVDWHANQTSYPEKGVGVGDNHAPGHSRRRRGEDVFIFERDHIAKAKAPAGMLFEPKAVAF